MIQKPSDGDTDTGMDIGMDMDTDMDMDMNMTMHGYEHWPQSQVVVIDEGKESKAVEDNSETK